MFGGGGGQCYCANSLPIPTEYAQSHKQPQPVFPPLSSVALSLWKLEKDDQISVRTIMLLRYYLNMVFNQVLEDSPSDIVWNRCFTCSTLVTCSPPPPPLPRKVGTQQLPEWEWGERPARCNLFPQAGFGSPLFTRNNSNCSLLRIYREPHSGSFILTTTPPILRMSWLRFWVAKIWARKPTEQGLECMSIWSKAHILSSGNPVSLAQGRTIISTRPTD